MMNPIAMFVDIEQAWKTIDHRLDGWLFMSSIWPVSVLIILASAVVVCGPIYMKTRPPLNIMPIMLVFNIFIVVFNIYIACQLLIGSYRKQYSWLCQPNDPNVTDEEEMRILKALHLFLMCKLIEMFDMCFLIARKKSRAQNSGIFVHHVFMALIVWMGIRWVPCTAVVSAILNAIAHAVMYTYFGLVVFSPSAAKLGIVKMAFSVFLVLQLIAFLIHGLVIIYVDRCPSSLPFAYAAIAFILGLLIYNTIAFLLEYGLAIKREGFKRVGIISYIKKYANEHAAEAEAIKSE